VLIAAVALLAPTPSGGSTPAVPELALARNGNVWTIGADGTHPRLLIRDAYAPAWYQDARASFDRKEVAAASGRFASVVQLIDSTAIAPDDEPMLSELRLLAAGFLDLTRAAARADAPAAVEPAAPNPKAPVQVTAPVPLKQELPAWTPPDPASRREFRGAVRVFISESGAVTGAELTPGVHPLYDRVLLQTARSWQYQPALRNSVPVPSEKIIEVVLKPR
jgi:hypothetical protein